MKKMILSIVGFAILLSNCNGGNTGNPNKTIDNAKPAASGLVIALTNETFKQKVFKYDIYK